MLLGMLGRVRASHCLWDGRNTNRNNEHACPHHGTPTDVVVVPHDGSTIACGPSHCRTSRELDLEVGSDYYFVVRAYNEANVTLDWYSTTMRIAAPPQDQALLIGVLSALSISLLFLLGVVTFCFSRAW